MSILDEIKKLTHPYEDEDDDAAEFEDEPQERDMFEERRSRYDDRRNKVVNIHATTQLKVVLVKPERFENASEIADQLKDKRTSNAEACVRCFTLKLRYYIRIF